MFGVRNKVPTQDKEKPPVNYYKDNSQKKRKVQFDKYKARGQAGNFRRHKEIRHSQLCNNMFARKPPFNEIIFHIFY